MRKRGTPGTAAALANLAVALVSLLGARATQAVPVVQFDDLSDPNKATGILNLEVEGFALPFNVDFVFPATASDIYGAFPGDLERLLPFETLPAAEDAANAVNAALRSQDALSIGDVGTEGTDAYNIGWITFVLDVFELEPVDAIAVVRSINETGEWLNTGENFISYSLDEGRGWAVFTIIPEPGATLLMGLGLTGLGLAGRPRRRRVER